VGPQGRRVVVQELGQSREAGAAPVAVSAANRGVRVRAFVPGATAPGRSGGRVAVLIAFATIYFVWGSTYLAIAYAVETMPPFLMMAARMLVAGGALYGWARWRGEPGLKAREWRWAAVTGAMLFLGGYGAVGWAEQYIDSGTAALLATTSPLWLVLIQWAGGGRRPGWRTWTGLGLGTAGVALLMGGIPGGGEATLLPAAAVLVAALLWAAGTQRASRSPLSGSASRSAGAEMLAGGVILLAVGVMLGEASRVDSSTFDGRSVGALAYLVVFGSIAGFGAYRWLLQVRPASLVATHSYVNPFVALLLGWMLAGESLGGGVLLAAVGIVGAIALLRSDAGREVRRADQAAGHGARVVERGGGEGVAVAS
jgi:drug/metabolite transporter (DMT)-like permease